MNKEQLLDKVITEGRQIEEAYEDLDLPDWTEEVSGILIRFYGVDISRTFESIDGRRRKLGYLIALKAEEESEDKLLHLFYNPDPRRPKTTDHKKVEQLIEEAIKILKNTNLPSKHQQAIVDHLNKALELLDKGNPLSFFSNLYHVIMILGAMGSFISGGVAMMPGTDLQLINEMRDKLEEANQIVCQISINPSFSLPKLPALGSENHLQPKSPPLLPPARQLKDQKRAAVLSRIRQLREATSSHWLTDQELTTIKQEGCS